MGISAFEVVPTLNIHSFALPLSAEVPSYFVRSDTTMTRSSSRKVRIRVPFFSVV